MPLRDRPVPADGHPTRIQVSAGEEAPDFMLRSTAGGTATLFDLRGQWVVLYFYPEDHTPGCTIEARRFRAYFEAISLQEAAIVGVSRDNHENHCTFQERHGLPFDLLSDEDAEVHDRYGAWRPNWLRRSMVRARRCTFLIDPQGIVRKVYSRVRPLNHAQEVVKDLERIARQRREKGQVGAAVTS